MKFETTFRVIETDTRLDTQHKVIMEPAVPYQQIKGSIALTVTDQDDHKKFGIGQLVQITFDLP